MPNGKNATNFFPYLILFIEGKIWISLFFFKRSKFFRSIIGIYLPLVNDRYEGIQHTLKSTYTSWYNFVVFNFREYVPRAFVNPNADWCVRVCVICTCTWRRWAAVSRQPFSLVSWNSNHSTFSVSKWYIRVYPSTSFFFTRLQSLTSKWVMETTLSRSIVAVADKRLKRVNDWSDT